MKQEIKRLLEAEASAILNIPLDNAFNKAIEVFYNRIHENSGKLITSGLGKAGQIAINIATTFSSTGTPAVYLHAGDAQHGDLGVVQKNDVMLLISNSGKTRELIELVELTDQLYPSIPIIVVTGNQDSPLAQIANMIIHTGSPQEICPLGLTPTTSTTTMTVIGDLLVVMMMKRIGFSSEDYAKRHHAGYLGEKSRDSARMEKLRQAKKKFNM